MLKDIKSYCHLKPGQNGTKRLLKQYGQSLLCVRYRYDANRGVKIKTVELIVEEKPCQQPFHFKDGDIVPITVGFGETELRERLRKMRAKWDPQVKLWLAPYRLIRGTDLEARIPEEFLNGSRKF
ncbi:MAG TPA: hypothetical protein VGJ93_07700 [Desulfuromonadaceae bacterium]